jgi:hypothetical protein
LNPKNQNRGRLGESHHMNSLPEQKSFSYQVRYYIQEMYGGLPQPLPGTHATLVHELARSPGLLQIWAVHSAGAALRWMLHIQWPTGKPADGTPVLLSPDGCWTHCVSPEAAQVVNGHAVALAWFNRLELADDPPSSQRQGPLFALWPGASFGALSAWAWGIQHSVDALLQIQPHAQVGVVGHSRGGKAALLAACTDTRIAAVISHNSGTAGAASLQRAGAGAESLQDLAQRFPHWLGPRVQEPDVAQELHALDGLAMLAALAPRGLCMIQAQDDAWANPTGTRHRLEQLRPYWHGYAERLRLHERPGGHAMGAADWALAAQFLKSVGS